MRLPQPVTLDSATSSVQRAHDVCRDIRDAASKADALGRAETARQFLRVALDELHALLAAEGGAQ